MNDLNRFFNISKGPLDLEVEFCWPAEVADEPPSEDDEGEDVVEGDGVVLVTFVVGDDEAALPLVADDGNDVWFEEEFDVLLDDPPAPDVLLVEGEDAAEEEFDELLVSFVWESEMPIVLAKTVKAPATAISTNTYVFSFIKTTSISLFLKFTYKYIIIIYFFLKEFVNIQ